MEFVFVENTTMHLDLGEIINAVKDRDLPLYGLMISVHSGEALPYTDYSVGKSLLFSSVSFPILRFKRYMLVTTPVKNTVNIEYDDTNNKLSLSKASTYDLLIDEKLDIRNDFNSLGKLKRKYVKNESGSYELKESADYNYLGLKKKNKDGENRTIYYKYDYFNRPVETRFIEDNTSAPHKTIEYSIEDFHGVKYKTKTIFDEEDYFTKEFYDVNGNVIISQRGKGASYTETTFNYDDLGRLKTVTSPMGKVTSYYYDTRGNLSQRTDPDLGTEKFKYDKFGNLRFSVNTAAGSERDLKFTSYDDLGRPVITGLLPADIGIDNLNGDLDYSVNQGSISHFENYESDINNFVVVNMYDQYLETGVFSNISPPVSATYINEQHIKGKLVATAFRSSLDDNWSYKVYTYDYLGQIKEMWVKFENMSWKKIVTEYDNLGNITKQYIPNTFYFWYSYDRQGRLDTVKSNRVDSKLTAKIEAAYNYDNSDRITNQYYPNLPYNQRNDYIYDAKGRLTQITNTLGSTSVRFRESLNYFDNDNIQNQDIRNLGAFGWGDYSFAFNYDHQSRLSLLNSTGEFNFSKSYSYDNDGNFILVDDSRYTRLIYDYTRGTNKLEFVWNGQNNYYTYDYKGNVKTDDKNNVTFNTINYQNLPQRVTKSGGAIKYKYDETGQRIYKDAFGEKEFYLRDFTGKELAIYDAASGRIKMANIHGNGLVGRIEMTWDSTEVVLIKGDVVIHTGKWVVTRGDERYYYVKDHLGSIRHTYDTSGVAAVTAQDYLPYGGILREYNNASPNERYKFTEKERDTETSYDYFGARYYDSDIGRWLSVDPLADLQPGINPYHYSFNNPLKYTDPTGMMPLFETIDELHDYLFPEFAGDDPPKGKKDLKDQEKNKKSDRETNLLLGINTGLGYSFLTQEKLIEMSPQFWQSSKGVNLSASAAAPFKILGNLTISVAAAYYGLKAVNAKGESERLGYIADVLASTAGYFYPFGTIVSATYFLVLRDINDFPSGDKPSFYIPDNTYVKQAEM
ncbi:MAG: RHS repeat-associated core domain-containing protein [Melioribacteraceae bacterium]|nr:RHS repeat-associated core domain-containing protein [Melioribacteraceae bacterium]MCF8396422.1 RHS repeat-associated core domain-containing protein [Melioribacteraceae bacterium]MCF8420354.1 RHS repeat-associated core domain-containing protein [Melioribacteraceae bacterium]